MANLKVHNDYLIFIDNVRIDHLVRSFSTSHSKDGQMPSASIRLAIKFGQNISENEYAAAYERYRADIYNLRSSIKNKANVFILVKNVVSGRFVTVFNGVVANTSIQSSRSRRFVEMNISCVGGIQLLHEIQSILALPLQDTLLSDSSAIAFKLRAMTLDTSKTSAIAKKVDLSMNNMTIKEILEHSKEIAENSNKTYSNPASIFNFNNAMEKIKLLSDIQSNLLSNGIVDMGLTTTALSVETLYVTLSKQLQRLMLEFYEVPDGDVLIKAPYWDTPILKNHIVPDAMIISESTSHRWSSRVSRIIVQGDLSFTSDGTPPTGMETKYVLPLAAYTEDLQGNGVWADLRNKKDSGSINHDLWKDAIGNPLFSGSQTGVNYLDNIWTLREVNKEGWYISYTSAPFTSRVSHIGWAARVISTGENKALGETPGYSGHNKNYKVLVQFVSGPYSGCFMLYGGIRDQEVEAGEYISPWAYLGSTLMHPNGGSSPNFFIKFMYPDYERMLSLGSDLSRIYLNPIVVLRDWSTNKKTATTVAAESLLIEEFSEPNDNDLLYGMSATEESQPIIKYSISGTINSMNEAVDTLKLYARFRYRTINSSVNTASVSLLAMPWIKPGFNLWVDPTGLNEVYYVNSVSHSGSPRGVYTSVSLSMGRPADSFFGGASAAPRFGAMRSGGTFGSNSFITRDETAVEDSFASVGMVQSFSTAGGYEELVEKLLAFKAQGDGAYNIFDDPFMRELYNHPDIQATGIVYSASKVTDIHMNKEMTKEQLESQLNVLYANCQSYLIKERATSVGSLVDSLAKIVSRFDDV